MIQGQDTKIELAIWKQKQRVFLICCFWIGLYNAVMFPTCWILDGYVTKKIVLIAALKHIFPVLFTMSFIVGGICGFMIILGYVHPETRINEKIRDLVKSSGGFLGEGEYIVRGARLAMGATKKLLEKATDEARVGGKAVGRDTPLGSVMVGGIPFPYGFENMGMFVMGSAGSGKSQVMKQMMYDIRRRNGRDRLIIYDRKPEYLPLFYREGDIIICPADKRHTPWDLFAEIKSESEIDSVVKSLFPDMPGTGANDKFWVDSGRGVFKAIVIYIMNNCEEKGWGKNNETLCKFLAKYTQDPKKLWLKLKTDSAAAFLAGSIAGSESPNGGGGMPTSVLATLKSYVDSFTKPEVAEPGWFSIRDWLRDPKTEGQAIFLLNPSKYESNYRSYYTVILDLALKEMISLTGDINRRVWFFIDEFGSLFKLDSIIRLLAEGRSKGAATVIGTQDLAQIKESYKDQVETLVNNCNSKCIARISSKDEVKYLSELIGEAETEKISDSTSISLDDNRGASVNLNEKSGEARRERKSIVLPSEIANLPSLNYYVKLCESDWMKNGIDYYPWGKHEIVPEFIEKNKKFFDTRKLMDFDDPD